MPACIGQVAQCLLEYVIFHLSLVLEEYDESRVSKSIKNEKMRHFLQRQDGRDVAVRLALAALLLGRLGHGEARIDGWLAAGVDAGPVAWRG